MGTVGLSQGRVATMMFYHHSGFGGDLSDAALKVPIDL